MRIQVAGSLERLIEQGREAAARRLKDSRPEEAALVASSRVAWTYRGRERQPTIAAEICGRTSALGFVDGGFGEPGLEEIVDRYVYFAHFASRFARPSRYHNIITVRPIPFFSSPLRIEEFSRQMSTALSRVKLPAGGGDIARTTLRLAEVRSDSDIGGSGAYVACEGLRVSFHYRCQATEWKLPTPTEVEIEIVDWMRMVVSTSLSEISLRPPCGLRSYLS